MALTRTRMLALLLHDVYRREPSESGFTGAAADRYKLSVAEFEAQLATLAPALGTAPVLADRGAPAAAAVPVAVTVDDGGLSYYTLVAERLEALGWRGHCFVTTGCIGRRGFLTALQVRELHSRGHLIGTHSVSHPERFAACRPERILREWSDSRHALEDVLGEPVTAASIPGGDYSRRVAESADAVGLRTLFTSEPVTRVGRVGRCDVIGRFTVRARSRPELARDFATLRRGPRFREWAAWNGKKVLKQVLGTGYPRLASWVGQFGAGAVHAGAGDAR